MSFKERLLKFLGHLDMGQTKFEEHVGIGRASISKIKDGMSSPNLSKISNAFPSLNIEWLITGEGSMLKDADNSSPALFLDKPKGAIPYYSDYPISAGEQGLAEGQQKEEKPTGYLMIPNVSAERLFPVIGCSMLPRIKAGDVIGINTVNGWDRVDPDKIYMIVTREERMLKRLRIDNEDDTILWCVSDNYKEFKIEKESIVRIFHVVYHGELM